MAGPSTVLRTSKNVFFILKSHKLHDPETKSGNILNFFFKLKGKGDFPQVPPIANGPALIDFLRAYCNCLKSFPYIS